MRKNKKQRRRIKNVRLKNKKILKRYPFLQFNDWWGRPIKTYDFTMLDDMPNGWRKCFGREFCEEIRQELIRVNDLQRYRFIQIKEKYGSLRAYDNGCVADSKIDGIISKYEYISNYTCIKCGRLDTPIINVGGWYEPICSKCYSKLSYKKPYDELTIDMTDDDKKIGLSYTTRMYKGGEWTDVHHDVSETVMKLLKKQKVRY